MKEQVDRQEPLRDPLERYELMDGCTRGPWTSHSGSVYADGANVHPKGPETGIPIAHMDREPGNGTEPVERDANAKLIAKTPAMLIAIKGAIAALTQNAPHQADIDAAVKWLRDSIE